MREDIFTGKEFHCTGCNHLVLESHVCSNHANAPRRPYRDYKSKGDGMNDTGLFLLLEEISRDLKELKNYVLSK